MKKSMQNIPAMQRGGAMLKNNVEDVLLPVGLKRYVAGGEIYTGASDVLSKIAKLMEERNNNEEEENRLYADAVLKEYKTALSNTNNANEFDDIASRIDEDFKKIFSTNEAGKKFFRKYGDELLEENRKDVEKLRVLKEYDFGQKTFKSMLANNQSMLINAENKKGDMIYVFCAGRNKTLWIL